MIATLKKFNSLPIQILFLCLLLILSTLTFSSESGSVSLEQELRKSLDKKWGTDKHTSSFIINKFKPLLDNTSHHSVIKDFIALSEKQNIKFSNDKKISPLPSDDGIFKATKEHVVVFENPFVRILWGSTEPGAREDFHSHMWKSVMVIIEPTTYEIEYPNGTKETIDYPVGVFELPAGEKYACRNLGKFSDASLRFEIKD